MQTIQGGKQSYRDYIASIFPNDSNIVDAFVENYTHIDENAKELLRIAYENDLN